MSKHRIRVIIYGNRKDCPTLWYGNWYRVSLSLDRFAELVSGLTDCMHGEGLEFGFHKGEIPSQQYTGREISIYTWLRGVEGLQQLKGLQEVSYLKEYGLSDKQLQDMYYYVGQKTHSDIWPLVDGQITRGGRYLRRFVETSHGGYT